MATINNVNGYNGQIVQQVRKNSTNATSTTTNLNPSNTPTTANTVFLDSLAMSPKNTGNLLIFEWGCPVSSGGSTNVAFYLFEGTNLLSSKVFVAGADGENHGLNFAYFKWIKTAGTTSNTTYSIYYTRSGGSGTVYVNRTNSGNTYGGVMSYSFIITEVTP